LSVVCGPSSGVKIGVVGPCGAGKSTLVQALRERGIDAHEIAQEHSGVPAMWQRITRPDLLVYLDVSRETAERRLERELPPEWWEEMTARLAHARAHADLIVETGGRTPEEVAGRVAEFLAAVGESAFATP
jgi:thymidylate kinase